MFAFARNSNRPGANLALAIALMCGTALGATVLESPAHAQKKKNDKEEQPEFSKEFREAFQPMADLAQGDDAQKAEAVTKVDEFAATLSTPDDKYQGGILLYNLGGNTGNDALQLQGMQFMLESGKAPADKLGSYHYTAYQLASGIGDYEAARRHLTTMADNDYTFEARMSDGSTKVFRADDIRLQIAESYWDQDDVLGGLNYLEGLIAERAAAGESFPETWITRGLSVAYEADDAVKAIDYGTLYVLHFPSETSWGDAIAIQRNMLEYDAQTTLDLLRLAMRTNVMRDARAYVDYIDAADARRLPGEVKKVVDAGIAAGKLEAGDVYVAEASQIANSRIEADRADLPALERDARAADASAVTASAAGDAFLSYGEAAKAEEMYRIALGKRGVDTPRVLTRLGIALADQGKSDEAVETFGQVEGARTMIAKLWSIYAKQKAASATVAAAEMPSS